MSLNYGNYIEHDPVRENIPKNLVISKFALYLHIRYGCLLENHKKMNTMAKIIKISESELKELIETTVRSILNEGIDVDIQRNVVMTDKHEKLVDTSANDNPTVLTDFIPNVVVWSIFKRRDDEWGDGNPLLYALKNEKNYKLVNPQKVYSRINYIIKKFFADNSGADITIAIPSTNSLNKFFAETVARNCSNPQYIDNLFIKMTTQEVADCVFEDNSLFRKHYGSFFNQRYEELKTYFRKMPYETFQFHKVANMEMRKVIEHTIKLSNDFYGKYVDAINGKNILIVDDSLTLGQTIKEACSIIANAYTPKSITVLTLFSPLYQKGGNKLKKN